MSGDLRRLADLLLLSSKTVNIINQNLLCGFGFIIIAIALSSLGFINPTRSPRGTPERGRRRLNRGAQPDFRETHRSDSGVCDFNPRFREIVGPEFESLVKIPQFSV